MAGLITPADYNLELAAALGRFSQICNYLERQIEFILTRLLPITSDMGRILFSGNQMRRNIEILSILSGLPEVPIPHALRENLKSLIPRLRAVNEDRSRFLHNPIAPGVGDSLVLIQHKQDDAGLFPISAELILQRVEEARSLWLELYVPPVDYDLTKWEAAFPQYPIKDYPRAGPPTSLNRKGQKQKGQPKSAGGKTNPKSVAEQQE
jgi:hypothetical protein